MPQESITQDSVKVVQEGVLQVTLDDFRDQFNFDPVNTLRVGVERECFTLDVSSEIVPGALKLTDVLGNENQFGYEFSACQIEERVGPCEIDDLEEELKASAHALQELLGRHDLSPLYIPVAQYDMPMDHYPDPSGRYGELARQVDRERLRAAFRVTATHVHVGVTDHTQALRVYNGAVDHFDELCDLGDLSGGERLEIYEIMAQHSVPHKYDDWNDLFRISLERGFVDDPRQCWTLIRISKHGTIEFRMFDTTDDIDRIVSWARHCRDLCEMYV